MNDGGGNGAICVGIKVRTDTTKLSDMAIASFGLAIKRSRVQVLLGVTALGKLFTPMCLCHQAVIGTGQRAVMLCGWGGNCRPGGK